MKLAFIISLIVQVIILVSAASVNRSQVKHDSDYLITVPKVLTNEQDKICLVWLNEQSRPDSEKLEVKVKEVGSETVIEQVSAHLASDTACVELPTKKIRGQRAELEITLGQKVSEKHEVQVRPVMNLVMIETSKPVYKPTETVEFNILTVSQDLKPVDEQFKKVWIESSLGTSIKQWRNVESKDGVLSFKLETAEENALGRWTIKALTKDEHLIMKVFELTRYLTPKINIDVTKPNYLLATDKQTEVEVRVTDQNEYPIEGKLKVTVGYKPTVYEQSREIFAENMPTEKFEQQIKDGQTKITIDHEKLQANSKHNAQRLLVLNIEVEQEKTKLVQTLIQELPISPRQFLITLPSSRMGKQYFKVNLPFKTFFTVEKPDLTEAAKQQVTVCYEQRQKSWISEKSNEVCQQFESDEDGIVRYETRPIKENTEQLFITVYPTNKKSEDEEQKSFVIQPYHQESEVNFIITPTIRREQCLKKHNVEIIFSNLNKKTTAFYQVVGRKSEAPVKFVVDPSKVQKIDSNLWKMNLEIESELLSSVSQPIARVVVFMRDANQTLVADYDTFEVNCEDKDAEIRVSGQSQQNKHQYEFNVDVNAQPESRCILQVSQQDARHELMQKRVARLMEKMDINLDLINRDKCEKELYVRHARNAPMSHVIPQENIINYKSSYDVFNKVGLVAISNMELDAAPCESELYPEGFSKEMSEEFEKVRNDLMVARNYYINDLSELNKIEQNTTEDLVQWIDLQKNNRNQKVIVRNDQISKDGELHFNAICLNPKTGIQFGHAKIAQNTIQPFEVDIVAPEQIIVNEVVHVYVNLHREGSQQHSVPVVVEPVSNSNFEISLESGSQNKFNFDSEHHKVIYRVRALHPISHTTLQFTVHDGQNGQHYPTKVHTHHMSIVNYGSIVRNTEYQILYNDQNGNKQIELVRQSGNGKEKQQVFNLTVSTDILDILIPKERKQQEQKRQKISARDGLSLQYKSPVELVSYLTILAEAEKTQVQDEQQRKALRTEMERIYQILETKRLPDGSYSTFIGKSAALPFADLALTSTIFKLYVQLKQNQQLPQISHMALKQTFYFLTKLQSEQGSFATPIQQTKQFPMSLKKSLDVTAYVVMQLAEAKSDFESPIMKRALRYIVHQLKTNSGAEHKEEQQLANAVVAYLYALKGNNEKAEQWSSKVDSSSLKDLNQLAKQEHGEQIIAIQTLTAIKMNKKAEIERLAKWLFNKQQEIHQDQLFSSPTMSQAIVRAWNALNGHNQTVKVNGKQIGRNQVRLGDNINKVTMEGKGFVIATYKKEQTRLSENLKHFKITVNGLNRGFKSCAQRAISVCYKLKQQQNHNGDNSEENNSENRTPVIVSNVQIPTGFQVDEFLLSNMLTYGSASQLDSFDIRQQNLHLLLKPTQSGQSHCVEIPIVQVQKVEKRQKNSIQMINYYDYQQQLSKKDMAQFDTIFYELPNECEVLDRPLFSLGQRARPQPINFRPRDQNAVEQHHAPLEILNCPADAEDSCPVCLDELNKSHEQKVCDTQFVSSVHRRDLKTQEREIFNQSGQQQQQQQSGKRCVVLPIKLEQIVQNKEQKLQNNDDVLVYVNEKCRCSYINERQGHGKAILVKNDIEKQMQSNKQAIQLTKDDVLVVYSHAQSNELPSCMKEINSQQHQQRRPKRDVDSEKVEKEADSKDEKNKRSGYGSTSASYSSPPSYMPAPAYAPPSPPTPSYSAPAPAPMSYSAPSYSSPAPQSYSSAPAKSYKRSASYGSAPAPSYIPTQPEYTMPQSNAYQATPGYMNTGYEQASTYSSPAASYSAPAMPAYSAPAPAAYAPAPAAYAPAPAAYAPAPAAYAPAAMPSYAPAPVSYKPAASAYKRSVAFDLATSASNAYQSYAAAPAVGGYGMDSGYGSVAPATYSAPMIYSAPAIGYAAAAAPVAAYGGSSYGGSGYGAAAPVAAYGGSGYGAAAAAPVAAYGGSSYGGSGYGAAAAAPVAAYGGSSYGGSSYGAAVPVAAYGGSSYGGSGYGAAAAAPVAAYGGSSYGGSGYGGSGYGSSGTNYATASYAVLYTPVRYATAYIPSYVTTSVPASSGGYGAVPASSGGYGGSASGYGGSASGYGGYASASERRSTVLKSTEECDQPASTCPVCDDVANLELLNNICKLDLVSTVYKLNQTRSSNQNKAAICGKLNPIENLTIGDKVNQFEDEYKYTIKENCECPQLRKMNSIYANAIVLAPKKNVNGQTVRLDENTFVLNDSIEQRHEIYSIAKQCNKENDLDLF